MEPIFERGDRGGPKGHALLYFRSSRNPDEVWATYLVVSPIAMDLAKYVPPMFASQIPLQMPSSQAAYPLPPLPEQVAGLRWLERIAEARDDDVLAGGEIDPTDLQRMLVAVSEVAQSYGAMYADWMARSPEPEPEPAPEPLREVDVDELLLSVASDREKVSRLAKLVGTLRYALDGRDARAAAEAAREMEKVGGHLDTKYRVEALIAASQEPGAESWKLAQLYVERAYKIAAEEYDALRPIEEQIRELERTREKE